MSFQNILIKYSSGQADKPELSWQKGQKNVLFSHHISFRHENYLSDVLLLLGYNFTQKPSSVPTEAALQLNTSDENTNSTTESDDSPQQSGDMHPAEFPNLLGLEPPALPEVDPLEEIQGNTDHDMLGENSEVFLNTVPTVTEDVTETKGDPKERLDEGSSGGTPQINPQLVMTNPTPSEDHTTAGNIREDASDAPPIPEIKITLIPHLSLTPRWEQEPSTPTAQESRSDQEYSAEPPVNEIAKEQEFTSTWSMLHTFRL